MAPPKKKGNATKKKSPTKKKATKKPITKRKSPAKSKTSKKPAKRKTNKKTASKLTFSTLFKWTFTAALWAGIALTCLLAWYASELPDITQRATFNYRSSITIKAADGSLLARYGDIRGDNIAIEDLPSDLIYAILATEDRRFYQHFGLDPYGLARAFMVNLMAGRTVQGGSTITQQLAKNLFLSRDRTLKRKAQEAMLALWLESELTKDEILSAYLNRVYLGAGTYGVDAAARLYFNKDVEDLNLKESAMIAGLLKAPSRYSPKNNPDLAAKRARVVLNAMVDAGFLTEDQTNISTKVSNTNQAPIVHANSKRYFTDWVMEQLDGLIGTPSQNIIIETTLDPVIQTAAQDKLSQTLNTYKTDFDLSEGAVLIMRYDGAVLGMVGGSNYAKTQFNRTTQALRQPGSAFKPVLYLAALEQGWRKNETLLDAPITQGKYRPSNYADQYIGEVTLEEALQYSLNTAAARLIMEVGAGSVIRTARQLGITSPLQRDAALALGSSAVTMMELTTAYATIANQGKRPSIYGIARIKSDKGDVIFKTPQNDLSQSGINRRSANTLIDMLETAASYGTGKNAKLSGFTAGKTGTTQNSRDAWFVGFSDDLVGAVWLGRDDNTPMTNVTGGGFPARIWKSVMQSAKGRANLFLEEQDTGWSFFSSFGGGRSTNTNNKPRYNN